MASPMPRSVTPGSQKRDRHMDYIALFEELAGASDWVLAAPEVYEEDFDAIHEAAEKCIEGGCSASFSYAVGCIAGRISEAIAAGKEHLIIGWLDFEALRLLVEDLPKLELPEDTKQQIASLLGRFEDAIIRRKEAGPAEGTM